ASCSATLCAAGLGGVPRDQIYQPAINSAGSVSAWANRRQGQLRVSQPSSRRYRAKPIGTSTPNCLMRKAYPANKPPSHNHISILDCGLWIVDCGPSAMDVELCKPLR